MCSSEADPAAGAGAGGGALLLVVAVAACWLAGSCTLYVPRLEKVRATPRHRHRIIPLVCVSVSQRTAAVLLARVCTRCTRSLLQLAWCVVGFGRYAHRTFHAAVVCE